MLHKCYKHICRWTATGSTKRLATLPEDADIETEEALDVTSDLFSYSAADVGALYAGFSVLFTLEQCDSGINTESCQTLGLAQESRGNAPGNEVWLTPDAVGELI